MTACMAETKPHSQWAPFGSDTSGQYTPLYLPVRASEKRYVQHAQAAPIPQLRGLRPAPQPSYASQSYRDYQVETPIYDCLLYTSPSPRDRQKARMPSSA